MKQKILIILFSFLLFHYLLSFSSSCFLNVESDNFNDKFAEVLKNEDLVCHYIFNITRNTYLDNSQLNYNNKIITIE